MSNSSDRDHKVKCFIAVGLFLIVSCAVVVPVVILLDTNSKTILPEGDLHRLACPRRRNTTKLSYSECLSLGCIWNETSNAPSCYLPEKNNYVVNKTLFTNEKGFSILLKKSSSNSFFNEPVPVKDIVFHVSYIDEDQLNFQISPEGRPLQHVDSSRSKLFNLNEAVYGVNVSQAESAFEFKIIRKDGDRPIWDTSIGGLIVESQFSQIATYLPSKHIYGLGENSDSSFRRTLSYKNWPMLIRKESPGDEGLNLYGFNPFYLCIEEDGKAHGVLFNNLFVSDYTLLAAPALSLRAVGGDLSFTVIIGQSPADVYRKISNIVGKPDLPTYWALGFHLAPFDSIQEVVENNLQKGVLLDAVHLDPDLWLHREVFKNEALLNRTLIEFIKENTNTGNHLHWIATLDPAVHASEKYAAYEGGRKSDAFIKWPPDLSTENKDIMLGNRFFNCETESVAFPDLMTEKSQNWWKGLVLTLTNSLKLDGFLTTANEPCERRDREKGIGNCTSNQDSCWQLLCPNNSFDNLQYKPGYVYEEIGNVTNQTVCMAGVHGDSTRHLEVHSSYGMLMSAVTHQGCSGRNERCLVMSRSTSMVASMLTKFGLRDHLTSIGRGLGNRESQWINVNKSIIGMLESNLFGIPYVGADICGSEGHTSPDLCKAWLQLGSMYPFARMRYRKVMQDGVVSIQEQNPANLNPALFETFEKVFATRYFLLPYMYTVFYHVHREGGAVIRPLFYEFPKDNITWNIDKQFMWGKSLMIAPVVNEGNPTPIYFPKDLWYRLYFKERSTVTFYSEQFVKIWEPITLPIFVRGGSILPFQEPIKNLHKSRLNPLSLGLFHKDYRAEGSLYWDDGVSKDAVSQGRYYFFTFNHTKCQLNIKRTHAGTVKDHLILNRVYVYNVGKAEKVTVDGQAAIKPEYEHNSKYVTIKLNISLTEPSGSEKWIIKWCD